MLRFLHPDWWKKKFIKYPALILAALVLVSLLIWLAGAFTGIKIISDIGVILASTIFLIQLSLIVSLPLSGAIHLIYRIKVWLAGRLNRPESDIQKSRRKFIKRAAAIIPGAAITSQIAGIAGSNPGNKTPHSKPAEKTSRFEDRSSFGFPPGSLQIPGGPGNSRGANIATLTRPGAGDR
jgi:hypothetical protein